MVKRRHYRMLIEAYDHSSAYDPFWKLHDATDEVAVNSPPTRAGCARRFKDWRDASRKGPQGKPLLPGSTWMQLDHSKNRYILMFVEEQ